MNASAAHRHFHDELAELKAKLLTMSGEAQDALARALEALLKRDAGLAARVIAGDGAIDALELEIEETVLDLLATQRIEELMVELKQSYTILIVTHNMQQASRVSDFTGFFYLGRLIEFGDTKQVFTRPSDERTEAYITGRFG